MRALNAFPRPCHRSSRLHRPHLTPTGGLWWCVVVVCCVLVLSVHEHHHVLVRAQFAANSLTLNVGNALIFNGIAANDFSGTSVSGVGDVNGDGVDDFVVGAHWADPFGVNEGQAYLLFGRNASTLWTPNPFELSTLDGTNGVTFNGVGPNDHVGYSVSAVNDVNGDGSNDMIIGTRDGSVAYVVFGVDGVWPATLNLAQGAFNGSTIIGHPGGDITGRSVSGAGDVNNDGIHDIAIGSYVADPSGVIDAGRMDVLYGRPSGSPWPAMVNLTTYVNASTGFSVLGENASDKCGFAVSGVGDVNGDGVDDVAVGCIGGVPYGTDAAGIVAVVFGSATGLAVKITPSQLNGTNGFVVNGQRANDEVSHALSPAGDMNADGLHDFAIGAPLADSNAVSNSGEMYLLFGRNAWPAKVNVSSLNGINGYTLAGSEEDAFLGRRVSATGDVNGDGIDDVLVGANGAVGSRGRAFLLYGRTVWPARRNSNDLDGSHSNTFEGNADGDGCGISVSLVGDVDGDGRGDLGIGCFGGDPDGGRNRAGQTAIVFGPLFTPAPTTTPTTTSPTTSPTPSTCATQGAFIPPGATCVNGVLVTSTNATSPADMSVTVSTSITITGGASFEQPSGSTLVFVADGSGSTTSIAVEGGGCAAIAGDAVVNFEADPSNGGEVTNTGPLVLVTADCVMGAFGSVSGTTAFEGDECVAIGDGAQEASGSGISVSFDLGNSCDNNSSGLSTGALIGVIVGGALGVSVIVIILVVLAKRARQRRAEEDVKMMHMKARIQ